MCLREHRRKMSRRPDGTGWIQRGSVCVCCCLPCGLGTSRTGEALPMGWWWLTRSGFVKRLEINDEALAAVTELPGFTDAINSAQWSSGPFAWDLLQLSPCSLNYPLTPVLLPLSPLQPAATASAPDLPLPLVFLFFSTLCNGAWGTKTERLKWVNEFSPFLYLHVHNS